MLLNCGVGEDSWESLGLQPVHPKGNQSWIFTGRTDVEAETQILWPPHAKNWLIWKDPDAGKDWGLEEKGTIEDEMVAWHHRLNGHEFEQTPGVGDGQGGLVCCSPWGCKESDMTEWLNWTELNASQVMLPSKSPKTAERVFYGSTNLYSLTGKGAMKNGRGWTSLIKKWIYKIHKDGNNAFCYVMWHYKEWFIHF